MKKRVLSALLVLCMACSMVSTVWAEGTNATSGAPEPASQTLNLDNGQPGDESGADSTGAPSDSTDSTSASSDSTSSSSATSDATSDVTSGEGDESAASSDSTAASDSTSSSSSASSDSSDSDADDQDAASSDVTGDESGTGAEEESDLVTEQPSAGNGVTVTDESGDVPTLLADEALGEVTLTYKNEHRLTVYLTDTAKNAVQASQTSVNISGDSTPAEIVEEMGVEGYEFIKAVIKPNVEEAVGTGTSDNSALYQIRYNSSGRNKGWQYKMSRWSEWKPIYKDGRDNKIYFIFREPESALTIADYLVSDGYFEAVATNIEGIDHYVWQVSDSRNGTYSNVAETGIGGSATTAEGGKWLYPSIADGANKWFKVQAVSADGSVLEESQPVQVPYYDELRNGGFEQPQGKVGYNSISETNNQIIWKTTADDHNIELVGTGDGDYSGEDNRVYGVNDDAEESGSQFAELNANEAGALYQDVLSVPGTTLNWQLMHRARNHAEMKYGEFQDYDGDDTMYVIIMSTEKAADYETQDNIENLVKKYAVHLSDANDYYLTEDGIGIWKITDGDSWTPHNGSYVVPDRQHVTRFFFASGDTAYDKQSNKAGSLEKTCGNFLDAVSFSAEVPEPEEGYANITVAKTLQGITDPGTITVTVTGGSYNKSYSFTASSFANGRAQYTFQDIPVDSETTFTVMEEFTTPEGYTWTGSTYQLYTIADGDWQVSGTQGTNTTVSFPVTKNSNYGVVFSNTYTQQQVEPEPEPANPDYHKYIKDNQDGTYDLSLDVHGTVAPGDPIPVDVLYVLDVSRSMTFDMKGDEYNDGNSGNNPAGKSYERMKAALAAIRKLNNTLTQDKFDAQYALVTFADEVYTNTGWQSSIETCLPGTGYEHWDTYASGTNYYAGIEAAKRYSFRGEDTLKVVIFVSDGQPTQPKNNQQDPQEEANKAIKGLQADLFYAVGVGNEDFDANLEELVVNATNISDENKDSFRGENEEQLVTYFEQLAADIAGVDCSNVTITDTLSEYAELAGQNVEPVITIRKSNDHSATAAQTSQNGVLVAEQTELNNGDDEESRTLRAVIGDDDKITLNFPDGYKLENGWTYTVTVKIKPSAKAYTDYQTNLNSGGNGYGDVKGDPNTDAPTNNTSSEKPGFHSNADNGATLTYTSAGEQKSEMYPHPVIQVKTATLKVTKTVEGVDTGEQEFSFTVYDKDNKNVGSGTIKKDETATISNLLPGTYTVVESTDSMPDVPQGDTTYYFDGETYKVGDQSINAVTLAAGDEETVTITNTYKPYKTLTIEKQVTGGMSSDDDEFTFMVEKAEGTLSDGDVTAVEGNTGVVDNSIQFVAGKDGANDKITFTMTAGGKVTLSKLKDTDVVTITEGSLEGTGYKLLSVTMPETANSSGEKVFAQSSNVVTATLSNLPQNYGKTGLGNVKFLNQREAVAPTGLESNHTTPYVLMIAAAGVAGLALIGGIVARRIRRRREE